MTGIRLIDANALDRNFYDSCTGECDCCSLHNIIEYGVYGCGLIHLAPTIDAVPVVHARWIDEHDDLSIYSWSRCSHCGQLIGGHKGKYCMECGAKMDAKEDIPCE